MSDTTETITMPPVEHPAAVVAVRFDTDEFRRITAKARASGKTVVAFLHDLAARESNVVTTIRGSL